MKRPIVASLWIGDRLSYIEQLCLKSFVDHGHRTILYSYDDVPNAPPGVEVLDAALIYPRTDRVINKDTGSPAPHSYAFRYALLEVQNIIWVDLDMLCLKPWDFTDQWVFGWNRKDSQMGTGALGLPRFSKTLAKLNAFCASDYPKNPWKEDDSGTPLHVSEQPLDVWGLSPLTYFLRQTSEVDFAMAEEAFYPITFRNRRDVLESGVNVEDRLQNSYGAHLWARRLSKWILATSDGFAPEDSFLGRKLREHNVDQRAAPLLGAESVTSAPATAAPAKAPPHSRGHHATPAFVPAEVRMQRKPIDPNLPVVATLWIGNLSFLEQMCLNSFRDYGHRVVLYVYGPIRGVPEGIELRDANTVFPNENFIRHKRTGSPAIHADAFRYKMLELEDVIWVDADMLCLKPWDFETPWVFGWEAQDDQTCNAVLGLPKNSKTLKKLNEFCVDEYPIPPWADDGERKRLEEAKAAGDPVHVSELKWGVWGPAALTWFLRDTGEIEHAQNEQVFFPIPYSSRRELLKPGHMIDDRLTNQAYGVHLWNRRLRRKIFADDGGVVDPQSFVGRALARHGVDPTEAPIEDDLKAHQEAMAAKEAAVQEQPALSLVADEPKLPSMDEIRTAMRAAPADSKEPMERRPIDPTLPTVAALWIGGTLSFLEQVCLLSFRDFGHRVVLYTYKGVDRVPDGIEVRDANKVFPQENYIQHKNSGSPALHSDVFRYWMLKDEDVIWIDADVLCVKPWRFETPFVYGWEKPPRLVCGAVLGFPKDSKTLNALMEFCKNEYPIPPWVKDDERARLQDLHDKGTPEHVTELPWGVWGPAALTHFLKETGEEEYTLPQEAFYPVSFKDRRDLLEPGTDLSDRVGRGCFGVHLWNRRIRRRIITHHEGIPHPDSLLGRGLLRHRIDPTLSPIPDQPPPGSPTQEELLAQKPPERIAKIRAKAEEKAAVYKEAPRNVTPDEVPPMHYDIGEGAAKEDPAPVFLSTRGEVPAAAQPPAAVGANDNDDLEQPESSNNPDVVIQRPKAMDEMPLMRLNQSPEAQQSIDNLEGRTGEITGYLKDPEQEIDNSKILVVTSMKNEAPFILEWVAYHKSIGVDHFLIYTNDCTDNTNAMLDRLADLGHVTRVDNPWDKRGNKKPQHVALKDALKQKCYQDANWVLTIDCDEFVNIHVGDGTFSDLFRASNYPNVISFTWKFFGNRDIHEYEDKPIIEQFNNCAPEFIPKPRLGWGFKSMFHKSSPYTRIGVHRPLGIDDGEEDEVRWVNGSGRAMPDMLLTNNGWRSTKRSLGYRLATLNHYILRSADSFLVKRERGRINHTDQDQGVEYWTRRNYTSETDSRIHARLPGMNAVLDEFGADPVLAKLHTEAVEWHEVRVDHLKKQPEYKALWDELVTPGRPDALAIAKEAEAEANTDEQERRASVQAAKEPLKISNAAPLTSLRMAAPPPSAATEPVHERFNDARGFAESAKGFLWEGPENALMFVPQSKRLVVAFDNISIARAEGQRWPWGFKVLLQDMKCSVLGVMAVQRNWFRQEFVHDAFEALRDQGFFEQFDEILF